MRSPAIDVTVDQIENLSYVSAYAVPIDDQGRCHRSFQHVRGKFVVLETQRGETGRREVRQGTRMEPSFRSPDDRAHEIRTVCAALSNKQTKCVWVSEKEEGAAENDAVPYVVFSAFESETHTYVRCRYTSYT